MRRVAALANLTSHDVDYRCRTAAPSGNAPFHVKHAAAAGRQIGPGSAVSRETPGRGRQNNPSTPGLTRQEVTAQRRPNEAVDDACRTTHERPAPQGTGRSWHDESLPEEPQDARITT